MQQSFYADKSTDLITEPHPGACRPTPSKAVTEPPPHQPDKAPTEQEEKNDQQQQQGEVDPPHPPHAPFSEPDIAPN